MHELAIDNTDPMASPDMLKAHPPPLPTPLLSTRLVPQKDLDGEEDELVEVRKKIAKEEESSASKLAELKAMVLVLSGEVSKLMSALDAAEMEEDEPAAAPAKAA